VSFYKFGPNDIFHNVIKTYPQSKFFIHSGNVYYNNKTPVSGAHVSNVTLVSTGHISLYEMNVDRPTGQLIYPFITKDSTVMAPKTVSSTNYYNSSLFNFGDEISSSYPLSSSIVKNLYATTAETGRKRVTALKNTLNYYTPMSRHYAYSSSFGDKSTQTVGLISIPSIFYGSTIKRGSVSLKYYLTGTLIGELQDKKRNGELVEVSGSNTDSIAGVVLYNEGFIVLTGSWKLNSSVRETYDGDNLDYPKWIYFGQSMSGSVLAISSSFDLDFKGTNPVPVITMFAHAPIGELNYSSNPTFISHGQTITPQTGSRFYIEKDELDIKNTVSSSYANTTGSFRKQTFISKIGIYDEKKNLIAIAKVATPVKKTEERDFTFKLKLDF
jgi:hypothetical protein